MKQNFFSSFDALMHETGHALYEFGLPKIHRHLLIGKSGGMSLHESQSLFIEMQIVKTQEFNNFLEELLRNKFNKTSLPWKTENLFSKRNEIFAIMNLIAIVLQNGMGILGVSLPDKM